MLMGEFKQELMKVNNRVNMEVFSQGLKNQKVEVVNDKVLIIAHNNRVKVLSVVDRTDMVTTRMMDLALIKEFKDRFVIAFEEHFGVGVLTHMKDYDPKLEISISVTVLEAPLEELLPLMQKRMNVE